jgi:flagellar protein FliO/FliZ
MTGSEVETVSWLRVAVAFIVVFGLMGVLGFVLKYISLRGFQLPGMGQTAKRLSIVESIPLDVRRRLVIVKCDAKEHLLLLGVNQDIVVESDLTSPPLSSKSPS